MRVFVTISLHSNGTTKKKSHFRTKFRTILGWNLRRIPTEFGQKCVFGRIERCPKKPRHHNLVPNSVPKIFQMNFARFSHKLGSLSLWIGIDFICISDEIKYHFLWISDGIKFNFLRISDEIKLISYSFQTKLISYGFRMKLSLISYGFRTVLVY